MAEIMESGFSKSGEMLNPLPKQLCGLRQRYAPSFFEGCIISMKIGHNRIFLDPSDINLTLIA